MERYRKRIYCDWNFLEKIISTTGEPIGDIDVTHNDNFEVVKCIKEFILSSDVKLFINVSSDQYYEVLKEIEKKRKEAAHNGREVVLTPFEKFLYHIELQQQSNHLHVHFNPLGVDYDNLSQKDEFLNAIFLTCAPEEVCKKAMDDFGVIVICAENINNFRQLLNGKGVAIRKHETNNWNKCLFSKSPIPCNSLIIVDNYIFDNNDVTKDCLKDIFNTLIPFQLSSKIKFQITFFTCRLKSAEHKLQEIKNLLSTLRPKIDFSVTIIKSTSDNFHDRNIITNNILITCGGGFDLFKRGKAKKTTIISQHNPFITSTEQWSRKAYSDILNDAMKVYNNAPRYGENGVVDHFSNFKVGDNHNRLIDNLPQNKHNRYN